MKRKILAVLSAVTLLVTSSALTVPILAAESNEVTISANSFDGGTDNGQALSYGTGNNGRPLTIVSDTEVEGNYYLNAPSTPGGLMQWKPQGGYEIMNKGWQGDKYIIEFDVRVPDTKEFRINFGVADSYASGLMLLYSHPNKALYFGDSVTASSVLAWPNDRIVNKWCHYRMELDIATKDATVSFVCTDTGYSNTKTYNLAARAWPDSIATPFDTIAIMTNNTTVDLDNFSIKAVSEPNSISSASYTTDDTIEIVFTYPVKDVETTDFTVTASNGSVVAFAEGSLSSDGLTYTLTPDNALTYGTYTVKVSENVASADFARAWETTVKTIEIADPGILGYHTFEGGLDNGAALNASSGGTAPSIKQDTDGNYYLYVPAIGWSMSRWYPAETSDIMKDKWLGDTYTVDFDFMMPTLGNFSLHFANTSDDRNGPNIFSYNSKLGFRERGGNGNTVVANSIDAGTWYHYTFELDIANRTGKAILAAADGKILGETSHVSLEGETDDWWKSNTREPFSKLAFLPVAGELALDNVKFSRDYYAPTVSAESIKILKDSEEQQWLSVSPLADKISIDFGTEMRQKTLAENVYVTKSGDTVKLAADVVFADGICTLTLDGALEKNTDYEIHILSGAANALGTALGKDYSFEFTTGAGDMTAVLGGVEKDGAEIKSFADFTGDVDIKIDYENTTGEDKEFCVIIAQYSANNTLVKVEFAKIPRTADVVSESISFKYSVPSAESAASAAVMLWDSITGLRALDGTIILGNNS